MRSLGSRTRPRGESPRIAVAVSSTVSSSKLDFCHHMGSVSVRVSRRFCFGVSFCKTHANVGVAKIQRCHKSRRTNVIASENVTVVLPAQVGSMFWRSRSGSAAYQRATIE